MRIEHSQIIILRTLSLSATPRSPPKHFLRSVTGQAISYTPNQ